MKISTHPIANIALQVIRKAGRYAYKKYTSDVLYYKNVEIINKAGQDYYNPATSIDVEVEGIIIEQIQHYFPDHNIIAEESGDKLGSSDYTWYVDPIDGTNNFRYGIPHWCVSIGVSHKGVKEVGMVYAPALDNLYTAVRSLGSYKDDVRMRVGNMTQSLDYANIGFIHLNHNFISHLYNYKHYKFNSLCFNCSALDMCLVANGQFDLLYNAGLVFSYDTAAAELILQEAGGHTYFLTKEESLFCDTEYVCGNNNMVQLLLNEYKAYKHYLANVK